MIRRPHKKIAASIANYRKRGIPYTFEVQNETLTLRSKHGSYSSRDSQYTIDEINFIKEVKQYILKNELYVPYMNMRPKKVMYFKYSKSLKPGMKFANVVNVDISSAYWETARKMGLLSDDLYKKGGSIRKQVRLSALGSLAKKRRIYEFDGKKLRLLQEIRSELTERIWDVICDRVSDLLMETAAAIGNKFIFFWVDGIYVQKGAERLAERFFKHAGYGSKTKRLKGIEITDKQIFVDLLEPRIEKTSNGIVKKDRLPFPFRNKKADIKKFRGYNRDL